MQRRDSWRACLYCIRKPGENQIWKSITSELVDWAASKNKETCFGRLLIKLLRVECWHELVFSRVEIWWIDGNKNRETWLWTTTGFTHTAHGQIYCWWRWYGLWHRRRLRHVVKIQIILAQVTDQVRKNQDQFSKDATQDSNKHSLMWRMFMPSTSEASVFMGKNYLEILHSKKFRKISHNETDVRHIWKVDKRTIRWDFWSVSNHLGRFSIKTIIFGQWWRSHQSLAREGLRIFRFCVMPWKDEREPTIKYCLGGQVDVFQKFINTELWTQLMVSQWNSSGIFSQDSPHCSSATTKSKSSCQKWANSQKNSQDGSSSCRCSTTSHGDQKTMNRNVN